MKPFLIVVAVVVCVVLSLNPLGSWMHENGIKEKDAKPCMQGATLKKIAFNYAGAAKIYQAVVINFPDSPEAELAMFKYARFLESERREKEAVQAYKQYIERYPDSDKVSRCQNAINQLEAKELN